MAITSGLLKAMIPVVLAGLACLPKPGFATELDMSAGHAGREQKRSIARVPIAPLAFQLFCLQHRDQCRKGGNSVIPYSTRVAATLRRVNKTVNHSIHPRNEDGDTWSLSPSSGDCDDYVMTKRSLLLGQGFPAGALRMAVVKTSRGQNHLVLVVRTTAGEFVLDNRREDIVGLSRMPYRLVQMSSANPMVWTSGPGVSR